MTIPYPSSTSSTVTYNDTQTIYFNEYWYESEYLSAGNTIDYYVQSQEPISFAIWDKTFDNFPVSSQGQTGNYDYSFSVQPNEDYQYITYYLHAGDTITYDFTASGLIEFFISDGPQLTKWNNYESSSQFNSYYGSTGDSGSFTAPHSQDWYLVWYNQASSGTAIGINVNGQYTLSSVDMSSANVNFANDVLVPQGTYTVPTSGTYYFFIYFDPTVSPAEKTDISFTIVYNKNLTSNDKWSQNSPLLTFLVIIVVIFLIVAIVQRRNAKSYEKTRKEQEATTGISSTTTPQSTITTTVTPQPSATVTNTAPFPSSTSSTSSSKKHCHVCGSVFFDTDVYCVSCGTKLIGRDYGVPTKTTPTGSKNCAVCGTFLESASRFCPDCGTQIK
jgi:hypothetical protein